MTELRLINRSPERTAVVHETVPVKELPAFFGRAFHEVMGALNQRGVTPIGPPFAKYEGVPSTLVEVEAGFPVSSVVEGGAVHAGLLPGGQVLKAVHVGPYDTMEATYQQMRTWMADHHLRPRDEMWEVYLSDPRSEPDPATWRTEVYWPVEEVS